MLQGGAWASDMTWHACHALAQSCQLLRLLLVVQEYMVQWVAEMKAAESSFQAALGKAQLLAPAHENAARQDTAPSRRGASPLQAVNAQAWVIEAIDMLTSKLPDGGEKAREAVHEQLMERDRQGCPPAFIAVQIMVQLCSAVACAGLASLYMAFRLLSHLFGNQMSLHTWLYKHGSKAEYMVLQIPGGGQSQCHWHGTALQGPSRPQADPAARA